MSCKGLYRPLAIPLGAIAVTLGLFGCHPSGPQVAGRPECPTDVIVLPSDTGYVTTTELAAPGPISLVPEYHDCQRFVNPEKTTYGPLVAIFATYKLDTVPDPVVPQQPTRALLGGTERAAATILNYNDPYEPLSIEHGINCLYMVTSNGIWRAHIVKVWSDSACVRPMSENAGGADLNVTVLAGPRGDSVPPVARWDWDPIVRKHYIGIRCGSQWCEVYDLSQPTLNSSPHYAGSIQAAVKGWYDEQYLAVRSVGGNGLAPGGVLATIIPVANLADFTVANFDTTWQKVAVVSLSDDSPKYHDKFNFVRAAPPAGKSEVWLCKGDPAACGISNAQVPASCPNKDDPWWGKIVADGTTRYRCVIRRTHPGISIPGAVRWRWQVDDEDMWIRCPEGCCEMT